MPTEPHILYLEPDDEITSVARRLREAAAGRIVLVTAGRTKATSSTVALRLLARLAEAQGRGLALVADAATRGLASEAGIAAYASLAEATAGGAGSTAAPAAPPAPPRAHIRIHRLDDPDATRTSLGKRRAAPALEPARSGPEAADARLSETQTVPVAASLPSRRRAARGSRAAAGPRRGSLAAVLALAAIGLLVVGAVAAVLPSAAIRISPKSTPIAPVHYTLRFDGPATDRGQLSSSVAGAASGTYTTTVAAKGTVVFHNFNTVPVELGQGTQVAAGDVAFATDATVVVPPGTLTADGRILAGDQAAAVTAVAPGPGGNLPPRVINRVVNPTTAALLRGFSNNNAALVENPQATAGGSSASGPLIQQADVDAAVKQLQQQLAGQLAAKLAQAADRLYLPPAAPEQAAITVPPALVGTKDQAAFKLDGTLDYARAWVARAAVTGAAQQRLLADRTAAPAGTSVVPGSIAVEPGAARLEGSAALVDVTVNARAASPIDDAAVRSQVAGLPADAASRQLAALGAVRIDLWPAWVRDVPRLGWRIDVRVEAPATK